MLAAMCRSARVLLVVPVLLSLPSRALAQDSLADLAGWSVPGLENVQVEAVNVGDGYFTGELPALQPPSGGAVPQIAGFDSGVQGQFALVVALPEFSIGDYVPALADTPLDGLRFSDARLLLAPPWSAGTVVAPPVDLAALVGGDRGLPNGELALPADGSGIDASIALSGTPRAWFGDLKLPTADLPLTGSLPTGLFTGSVGAGDVASELYPHLDLMITASPSMLEALTPPLPGATMQSLTLHVEGSSGTPVYELTIGMELGEVALTATAHLSGDGETPSLTVTGDLTLADLVGVDVPGFDGLQVTGVTMGGSTTAADLKLGSVPLRVTGFNTGGEGGGGSSAVALTTTHLKLSHLVAAAAATPLDDLTMDTPTLIYVDAAVPGATLPEPLASRLGAPEVDLSAGLSLSAVASLTGDVAALLRSIGVPTGTPPLSGTLDPSVLSNPATLPDLRLAVSLGTLQPAGVSLTQTELVLSTSDGVAAAEVQADAQFQLGSTTVEVSAARVARPGNGTTKLEATLSMAELAELVPLPGMKPVSATIDVTLGETSSTVSLGGLVEISGKQLDIEMSSDTGSGRRSIALAGSITVGELSGLDVPGLTDLALTDLAVAVTPTSSYTAGGLTFGGAPTKLVMFKQDSQPANNIALLADELTLGSFVPAAQGTPLDALTFSAPALFIVPTANGVQEDVPAPAPVAQHRSGGGGGGAPGDDGGTMDLSPGIRIESEAGLTPGPVADLLAAVGAPVAGLPLDGTLELGAFEKPSLPDLDLALPLPELDLPIPPTLVSFGDSRLRLRSQDGDPSIQVETAARVSIDDREFAFATTIEQGREDGVDYTALSGSSDSEWAAPFGVDWLSFRDLTLAARLGATKSLAIAAKTDVGRIRRLKVATAIRFDEAGFQDAEVSLTGADIPLSEIPEMGTLPGADQFTLRDLVVSNTALAGKGKMKGGDWLSAVLFESREPSTGWNLALLYEDIVFSDLIPGLPADDPILSKIRLDTAALVVSQKGVRDDVGELPPSAQERMLAIYGDADRRMRLPDGVGLVGGFDPTADADVTQLLTSVGVGTDKLTLSGAIGGLFSGLPSLDLAAGLPPVVMPETLSFLVLPQEFETAFYVRLETLGPSIGVSVAALSDMLVGLDKPPQEFETTVEFELNAEGGVSMAVSGATTQVWPNPFGIPGLILDPGCKLGISVSATSEVLMDVTAQTHIGDREVDLTGAAGVIGGYPAKAALIGQVSELKLADVMALSAAVTAASGNQPVSTDYPEARLTDTGLGFASPLATAQLNEVELLGPGVYLEGDLWLLYQDEPLGRFKGTMDALGIAAVGDIHDIELGGFAMEGNALDVYARVDPFKPPHFKVLGNATISGVASAVEMAFTSRGFDVGTAQQFENADFSYDFRAYFDGPTGFTPAQLAQTDLGLDCGMDLGAIEDFLAGPGADAVGATLDDIGSDLDQANADLAAAQAKVDSLDDEIDQARDQVRAERGTMTDRIAAAQKGVDAAKKKVNGLEDRIAKYSYARKKKGKCRQKKKVLGAWVPNVPKRLKCAKAVASYTAKIAAAKAELELARASLTAAKSTLAALKAGVKDMPVDADPRVASSIAERESAQLALAVAQKAVDGMSGAADAAQSGLALFEAGASAIDLQSGRIHGSLNQLLRDRPVILDVACSVEGQDATTRLPFNPADPDYSFDHMELLALKIAYAAALADPEAPPGYVDAASSSYLAKKEEVDAEIDRVSEDNAVAAADSDADDALLDAQQRQQEEQQEQLEQSLADQQEQQQSRRVESLQQEIDVIQQSLDSKREQLAQEQAADNPQLEEIDELNGQISDLEEQLSDLQQQLDDLGG